LNYLRGFDDKLSIGEAKKLTDLGIALIDNDNFKKFEPRLSRGKIKKGGQLATFSYLTGGFEPADKANIFKVLKMPHLVGEEVSLFFKDFNLPLKQQQLHTAQVDSSQISF